MRVLVVDDESLIRMDICDALDAAGYEIVGEGQNGVEALQLTKTLQPDIIVMDVKMPELDGIEAARQIRHLQIAPVVLLTAYSQQDLVKKAAESGVYGYLIKPLNEVQLIPTLEMAYNRFQESQLHRETIDKLEDTLEEQKWVRKATAILMENLKINEDLAYRRIRSFAMDKRLPVIEVCRRIIKEQEKKTVR